MSPGWFLRFKRLTPGLFLSGLWVALVGWFAVTDVYNQHFSDTGILIATYNILRFIFCLAFLWYLYALGRLLLFLIPAVRHNPPQGTELFLYSYFTGVGFVTVVMLVLGLVSLYSWWLAVFLTTPVFFLSGPHFIECVQKSRKNFSTAYLPLVALSLACLIALFLYKGLYPNGGHDYFTHYFQYYVRVIENGGVLPNAAWYHFFYSRALGIFFLPMLLTDPLAPALVGTAFIIVAGVLVHLIMYELTQQKKWAWTASAMYFLLMAYTQGLMMWGELEKFHVITGILTLFIIWFFMRLQRESKPFFSPAGLIAVISVAVTTTLISLPAGALIAFYVGLMLIINYTKKYKTYFIESLSVLVACALALVSVLIVNFIVTGIPSDILLPLLWPYIDFTWFEHRPIGVSEMILTYWVHWLAVLDRLPALETVVYLFFYFRLDHMMPLFLLVLSTVLLLRSRKSVRLSEFSAPPARVLWLFIASFCFFSLVVGRQQYMSFYRFSVVSLAPVLCLLLWVLSRLEPVIAQERSKDRNAPIHPFTLPFFILVVSAWFPFSAHTRQHFTSAARFVSGQYSIEKAYDNAGGIYPPMKAIHELVGRSTRVWSFHTYSYCMLPSCGTESFFSFQPSRRWMDVMFGPAEDAKKILQSEGLNYFLFSCELITQDILPFSPLFAPETIGNHLAIKWTDGCNALLTWKAPGMQPFDARWRVLFKEMLQQDEVFYRRFPYESLKKAYDEMRKTGRYDALYSIDWGANSAPAPAPRFLPAPAR